MRSYRSVAERNSGTDPFLPDHDFLARSDAEAFDALRTDLRALKEPTGDIVFRLYHIEEIGELHGPEFLEAE